MKESKELFYINPIPTSQGRNQPLYERHVTKSGRNRVKKYTGTFYVNIKI